MFDPPDGSERVTRTGHFVFRVWRKKDTVWSWRLRVEAVDTGACGVFDSMQDALWFMREHMTADQDAEGDAPEMLLAAEPLDCWLDDPVDLKAVDSSQ